MAKDPHVVAHQEWIGYVQPVGLVVSIPALLQAGAAVDRNIIPLHQRFIASISESDNPAIVDFPGFTQTVLDWRKTDLLGGPDATPVPTDLEVALPEYNETLRPTYVVPDPEPTNGSPPWLMLIQELPLGTDFDEVATTEDRHWQASPQARMERLLRETQVPIGLLLNGTQLRLVYAPRGENSGHATFKVSEMATVAGRPMFAAVHMLLSADRLFGEAPDRRLPALLANSRKYQSLVSNQLAEQVLAALYELLRGFQAADDVRHGQLLGDVLKEDPNQVYKGLLTVLMRLVFLLYAEDRGLLSTDPVYVKYYSIAGLFERLRADAGRYPDTMDQRFGAWAQLITLFRLVYDGGGHGGFRIPPREGYLFDPDRYPFLEGRPWRSKRDPDQRFDIPRVPDGVVFRVLQNLIILDGERLSYRTLDVEQIGSVYETIMGFYLEVAEGKAIAIKPKKSHGAPTTINLEELLATKPADRAKWLSDVAEQKLTGQAADGLKSARTVEDLLAALDKKIARNATPNVVPKGAMVFQPSDERRRSGSHYTPRSLTEPIVRKALEPVLKRLGDKPTPDELLDLKVCDMACGSGAFLVEACRQLGDELVKAWHTHNCLPKIPPDEDELLHARRLIAQRCVYGVDRNPMAVDLAKLSLWLATLARDHAFTFLDHNLRCGDSLVGLTCRQIADFYWQRTTERRLGQEHLEERIKRATQYRKQILDAGDTLRPEDKAQKLAVADEALDVVRLAGDLCIAAFFAADKDKQRNALRDEYLGDLTGYLRSGDLQKRPSGPVHNLRSGEKPVVPFHWEIEFPEVFGREEAGFDAFVGNPPFAGKNTLINGNRERYLDWLQTIHEESHGNADLVAHFFRRAFNLLRKDGCFGLIATNTIGQGDTRSTGLRWICTHGGTIYAARKRYKWPGQAAVIVSVVHASKGSIGGPFDLDGRSVQIITAYLFHAGGHEDPSVLKANYNKSFQGPVVLGMGFTFDDTDTKGVASSIAEMHRLIAKDRRNADRIFPYIGGEEVNHSPTHAHHRHVINFGQMSEEQARQWPDLMQLVEERVRPERDKLGDNPDAQRRKRYWWQWGRETPALYAAIDGLARALVLNCGATPHMAFTFIPSRMKFANTLDVFPFDRYAAFAVMQCRVHEVWVRFLSSSMKDDLRYTPTDCFETFPFPVQFETHGASEQAGRQYFEFRAALMVRNNEGMTKTYNRFHDPEKPSPEVMKLRELHAAMDRAVLDAYGWTDIPTDCQFLLDYEEEEDEDDDPGAAPRARTRKKPWRYRWPDEVRDEVLARLLDLNAKRAEEERQAAQAAAPTGTSKAKRPKRGRKKNPPTGPMLIDMGEDGDA